MMKAKYRFHCRSWGYECISDIGAERGPHRERKIKTIGANTKTERLFKYW